MTAQTKDEADSNRWQQKLRSDGGEVLCVACGEAYEMTSNRCPVCGHRPTTNETTAGQDPESTGDNGSRAVDAGNVVEEESQPAQDQSSETTETRATGSGHEDVTSKQEAVSSNHKRVESDSTDSGNKNKSPLIAVALSFLFIGAGHVYIGEIKRGVGVFFSAIGVSLVTVLTVGLAAPLLIVVWGWAMYDVYKRAA